jgi:hypothetical protein
MVPTGTMAVLAALSVIDFPLWILVPGYPLRLRGVLKRLYRELQYKYVMFRFFNDEFEAYVRGIEGHS